jgi:Tfp pilus assembly protein FimT
MNLVSTMVLVAIVAILSLVAIPDWVQTEQDATISSAAEELASARLALQRSAAEDTGATLVAKGTRITITGNGGGPDWTGNLPSGTKVFINGAQLGCVSLGGSDVAVTTSTCSAVPSSPMVWSAQVDGHTETLP